MIDGTRNQAWLFWLGLSLSLAVHVGLAAHLLSGDAQDFGATNIPSTAISVNLASSDILESIDQSEASEAAPSQASTAGEAIPPQEAEPEKAEISPPPTETQNTETLPPTETVEDQAEKEAVRRSELAQQQEQQRIAEEALRKAAEAEREKQAAEAEKQAAERVAREKARRLAEEEEAREEREAAAREAQGKRQAAENQKKADRPARQKSGDRVASAGTSGSRGARAATGRVSASHGDLQNYKGIVNAWIARDKPAPPSGGRGTVVILLALSPSGALSSAHVHSSSGNRALDQIALAGVRRASPFPKPPPGSTASQLRFTFPYQFR